MTEPESVPAPRRPGPDSDEPTLRPHIYDGIQEFDQQLPNWWLFTFYIAIAFFVVIWVLYYQVGVFMSPKEKVSARIMEIQAIKAQELEKMLATLDDQVLWTWSKDPVIVRDGQAIFDRICAACHAHDLSAKLGGAALPGLPLNDGVWKYGNQPMDVFRMVRKGSPDKTLAVQMPPWEAVLSPSETAKVAAFVMSHHDSSLPVVPSTFNPPAAVTDPAPK